MDDTKPKLNYQNLTSEQRDKLEAYQQAQSQLQTLHDIADMTQEMTTILHDTQKDGKKVTGDMGALLMDMRDSLTNLKDKEMPQAPDYAKPVLDGFAKLEKALTSAIKTIDVKPQVNLDAPQVNVSPPSVDLKGVEKVVKDIPKAFEQAIKLIPKTEVPETDFRPLLTAWEGISEQLVSIENATRMKPLPGSMAISNLNEVTDELQEGNIQYAAFQFDPDDSAPDYIGKHIDPDAEDNDDDWVIYKFTYSGSNTTSIIKKVGSWTNRTNL